MRSIRRFARVLPLALLCAVLALVIPAQETKTPAPAAASQSAAPPGSNVYRYRANFYEYATLPDGTKVASNYSFYVRVSCTKTVSGYQFVSDVANDNQIGPGSTKISWNLQ